MLSILDNIVMLSKFGQHKSQKDNINQKRITRILKGFEKYETRHISEENKTLSALQAKNRSALEGGLRTSK